MKRFILCGLCVVSLCGMAAQVRAASYDNLWKQVKEYERKDLPKSAYAVVEQIAAKAGKEGKKGQRMAALLYGCKLRQQVVPDSFYTDMLRLERLKRQATDEVERAVLASVLAGLYEDNAGRNRNNSRRTDAHPDSIREWSRAQFWKAASENYRLSMAHPALLAEARAADYLPFVERGENASYFNGDLLNVIGRRAAYGWNPEDLDAGRLAVYGRMLEVYRSKGSREAELLVLLDSVAVVSDEERRYAWDAYDEEHAEECERWVLSSSSSYKAYRQMLSRFGDLPLAAEIYIAMVDRLPVTDSLKVQWVEEGYGKYKDYPRAKALLNDKERLEAPSLTLGFPAMANPDVPFEGVVEHCNVSGMELRWYLLPGGVPKEESLRAAYHKDEEAYAKKHGRLMKTQRLEWSARPAWAEVRDTFMLSCPGVGYYVVVGKADGVKDASGDWAVALPSTRLELVGGVLPDSTSFYTVLDGRTGRPVPGATVEWLSGEKAVHSAVTDAEGKVRWTEAARWTEKNNRRSFSVKVHKGEDRYHQGMTAWPSSVPFNEHDGTRETERLYTDRAIYRPGQTVYVGGLCTDERRGEERAVAGRKVALELRDPNGKTVAEQTVESDGMGTVAATFTLPATGLSGEYVVKTKNSAVTFTVEEYKRPTFEVTLDELSDRYRPGDTLRLTGVAMNYNGVPLRAARVSATSYVSRWFYRRGVWKEPVQLDTVYTDAEGRFVLSVPVREMEKERLKGVGGFRQVVDVAVLSASGETQKAQTSFPLSKEGLQLSLEGLSSTLVKEALPSLEVLVRTAAGTQWKETVTVTCDIFHAPEGGPKKKVVSGIQLPAARSVRVAELSALPSGCYELALRAVAAEDTAEYAQSFRIFSLSDARPADGVKDWFYCVNDTVAPGRPGHLKVGSAADSVSLYYMLFCRDRVLEEKVVQFSDSILDFTYPEIPEGADGMQAVFYFVKDGEYYNYSQHLVRCRPDRSLRLSWLTFRDRLQPGTDETWRLRVTLPDGRPAPAQLMSVLYDASLDGIRPHAWQLQRYFTYALPHVSLNKMWWFGGNSMTWMAPFRMATVKSLSFDRFSDLMLFWGRTREEVFALQSVPEVKMVARNAGMGRVGSAVMPKTMALNIAETDAVALEGSIAGLDLDAKEEEQAGVTTAGHIAVRGDLRETAFFYPRLMADSAGVVTLRFTLPEGLTTWKFMALAHTADMYAGTFTDEVVAQKEVMAQLNLPRFVRLGDRATLSASLFNLTEQPLQGTVTMEVFDPATEKILWSGSTKVSLDAETDSVVSFVYEPEPGVSLPACRVLFEAGEYTDGEQRYLPILEDKEWLTQTRPFVVSHRGDTLIRLDGLFQNNHREADRRRLTVEYTANPLWYAVQALPSVQQPQTDDVLSLAAAYYASTLSDKLAGQYPQMKKAIDSWMQEGGETATSMQAELAGIVLEETPWVADAEAGTQRMMALQQLFDANRQADLRRQFAVSLGKLQHEDGAFGWFGGMEGNAYLTRRAARLLLRSGAGRTADETLASAVDVKKMMRYLMDEAHDDILKDREHKAEHKTYLYSASDWLETLYLLNLCDASWWDAADRKDADYMLARLTEGMHGLALADKAEAAVVLTDMGKPDEAAQLLASIREHLVDGAEGLHIEYQSNGFVGSDRKMAVHTALMEALALAGGADRAEADGLCRWLLSQKRLQDWGISTATMEAVYALLQGQGQDLTLHAGDQVRLESPKGEEWAVLRTATDGVAGLGTVTATVEGRELDGGAGVLKVTKQEETPSAWGAAYAQFRLPLAEVEGAAAGLRVRVETDNESPKVGDRLTLRYVITSDRDYEYVRLKAGRAACLEPVEALSGYERRNGLGYYKEVKDASTNYFFERLPKGTYVLEMECYVERAGRYTVGAAKLNGVYAPEFSAYASGMTLEVRP